MVDKTELERIYEERAGRFRILVCIDGSDESYRGLRYAATLSRHQESDIVLLYVRPVDQGLRSGGLQVRVARENMLKWGLELPGIQYLKKGRDMLMEDAHAAEWNEKSTHTEVDGDPLGDNKIEYTSAEGKTIVLKLKTATNIATGIVDQYDLGPYDLIILGSSGGWGGLAKSFWDPAVAEKVAVHAPCSVLVARELEAAGEHLVCTDGSDRAAQMLDRLGGFAKRGGNSVSLLSVALDAESEPEARRFVDEAQERLHELEVPVTQAFTRIGNPVEEIIEAGKVYSMIALADTGKSGLQRFFMGSVAFKVMEYSKNSVMIVR
jgi:nucleotide-binding universal stress UspA family protein